MKMSLVSILILLFPYTLLVADQIYAAPPSSSQKSKTLLTPPPSSQPLDVSSNQRSLILSAHNSSGPTFGQPIHPKKDHSPSKGKSIAIFAGGCFWCMEAPFESVKGVSQVLSGYIGGVKGYPTYQEVSASQTKHLEAVIVYFNPKVISYSQLLDIFWRNINPTQTDGQFADRGDQYKTAIFYITPKQKSEARRSKSQLSNSQKFSEPIATRLIPASVFWPAEDYHQNYYKTNPTHYQRYKIGSGRARYLKNTWGSK